MELRIQLAESGADAERVDQLTGYLRQELLELDVDDVKALPAGDPPPGSRAFEAAVVGGLIVTFAEAAQGVRSVVSSIRAWLARGSGGAKRTIRLELDGDVLELSEVSATEQTRLIELFLTKHSGAPGE
ncbi:hypothetical protein [Kribbella sp. NPDC055071]